VGEFCRPVGSGGKLYLYYSRYLHIPATYGRFISAKRLRLSHFRLPAGRTKAG
jgi:hypothetical protein